MQLATVQREAQRVSAMRTAFGLGALLAPGLLGRIFGISGRQDVASARFMTRLWGVRELALAAATVQGAGQAATLERTVRLNLAVDAADAASSLPALLRREGLDRAALMTVAFGLVGAAGWARLLRALA